MKAYGNLMNRICEESKGPVPEVGMGATEYMYSDRVAYTVTRVITPRMIAVVEDEYKVTGGCVQYGDAEYEFTPGHGSETVLRLNKRGQWKPQGDPKGSTFVLGNRSRYYDPTF